MDLIQTGAPDNGLPPPPAGGISLSCDDTYQRVQIIDRGVNGKSLIVDNRENGLWVEAWRIDGGDPMVSQLEAEAGYYPFGVCEHLVVVPLRYAGCARVAKAQTLATLDLFE